MLLKMMKILTKNSDGLLIHSDLSKRLLYWRHSSLFHDIKNFSALYNSSKQLCKGSSGSQTVIQPCRHLFERCLSPTAIRSSIGKMVSNFSMHYKCSQNGEYSTSAVGHLQTAEVSLDGTSSKSAAQRAQQPTKGLPGSQTGKTKKGAQKKTTKTEGYQLKDTERSIVFECDTCTALCVKRILRDPFERGVVIVRCLDCWVPNLLADHLDLFKEPGSVEKFLSDRGVDVIDGPEATYEITPENLAEVMEAGASTLTESSSDSSTSSTTENLSETSTSSKPEDSSKVIQSSTNL